MCRNILTYMALRRNKDGFGERLKSIRKRKNLTQLELADAVGCSRGYIGSLETGAFSPSMTVLRKLAAMLGVEVHELLYSRTRGDADAIPILNTADKGFLAPQRRATVSGKGEGDVMTAPGIMGRECFAEYLPDNSMAPDFGQGDLVILSLTRKPQDGDTCLVDTGKGQVLFRAVWALPAGQWRLQPSNPKFAPMVIKASKRLRMWPVVGFWRMLGQRRGGRGSPAGRYDGSSLGSRDC